LLAKLAGTITQAGFRSERRPGVAERFSRATCGRPSENTGAGSPRTERAADDSWSGTHSKEMTNFAISTGRGHLAPDAGSTIPQAGFRSERQPGVAERSLRATSGRPSEDTGAGRPRTERLRTISEMGTHSKEMTNFAISPGRCGLPQSLRAPFHRHDFGRSGDLGAPNDFAGDLRSPLRKHGTVSPTQPNRQRTIPRSIRDTTEPQTGTPPC